MFPQGARFIQDINEVIDMFPEDKDDKLLRSSESRQKGRTMVHEYTNW